MPPEDVVVVHGFRVTSITRTLVDLAGDLSMDEAIRVARDAMNKGLVTLEELRRVAETRDDIPSIDRFRQVMREIDRP